MTTRQLVYRTSGGDGGRVALTRVALTRVAPVPLRPASGSVLMSTNS